MSLVDEVVPYLTLHAQCTFLSTYFPSPGRPRFASRDSHPNPYPISNPIIATMKLAIFLFVFLANPFSITATPRGCTTYTPFISRKSKDTTLKLRGGGGLGPVSGKSLAKTFGVLAIGDALTGTVSPVDVWDKFGVTVEPGSKSEHYLGHGLASSAASLSVTSLFALCGKVSTEEAIAYGFLTRGAFMTEMLLNGKYKELGVPSVPHLAIYLILLGTSFSLLSGTFEPMAATKIISILLTGHGALLFLNPRIDGKYLGTVILATDS